MESGSCGILWFLWGRHRCHVEGITLKLCWLKKKKKAQVENYIFSGQNWGRKPRTTAFQTILRSCSKDVREEPGFIGVFVTKTRSLEHQKVTVNERIRYLKLSNLALFCLWEEAWVRAHWNHSFDMHLGYLLPVSILSQPESPSGCTVGGGRSVPGTWQWAVLFLSIHPWLL